MTSQDPLVHCLERLHLADDAALRQRAEHFLGQCSTRIAPMVFDKGPYCKQVIAIQLAYESLEHFDWNKKLAAQLAACSPAAYQKALSMVRKQLNIQPVITFESLTVAFGCTTMLSKVTGLWKTFVNKYVSRVAAARRQAALDETNQPIWRGAVFYTCAKACGEVIDKKRLETLCSCGSVELTKAIKTVKETCATAILELKKTEGRSSRRRQHEIEPSDKDETDAPSGTRGKRKATEPKGGVSKKPASLTETPTTKRTAPVSGIAFMINRQPYKETRRYKEYVRWKEDVTSRLRQKSVNAMAK